MTGDGGLRRGHSLPELIVAVTFLGVGVAAVSASTILGARWTGDAVARQRAVDLAAATLDSLVACAAPTSGSGEVDGLRVEWRAHDDGRLTVTVLRPDGGVVSTLHGRSVSGIPVLPDGSP
ncbi:MAG: hypothetical protein ACLFRX_02970 [Gemmatimonadota bacterium]